MQDRRRCQATISDAPNTVLAGIQKVIFEEAG
jgi:hypothetical protein